MSSKRYIVLSGFIIFFIAISTFVFAQEPPAAPVDTVITAPETQTAVKATSDAQWAWGEVINLDPAAKTITLKYLDYETDQEKDLVLTVDENTAYENIKSFEEIKVKDTLSIDYALASDGKNIAKNINFEKPDLLPAAPAQTVENDNPVNLAPEVKEPAPVEEVATTNLAEDAPAIADAQAPVVQNTSATDEVTAPVVENTPTPVVEEPTLQASQAAEAAPASLEAAPAQATSEPKAQ